MADSQEKADSPEKAKKRQERRVKIITYTLVIGTFVLGMLGCMELGIGIFLIVDQLSFVEPVIGTSMLYDATVLWTTGGALCMALAFVGCCSIHLRHKGLLGFFIFLLMSATVLHWIGAAMAIVYRSWFTEQVTTYMRDTLQTQYGLNTTESEDITRSWDKAQQKWYCCAVEDNSWGVYRQSEWYGLQPGVPEADKPLVPLSCCKKDQYGNYVYVQMCQTLLQGPPTLQTGEYNPALFYRGCYVAGEDILYDISGVVIGFGIALFFLLIVFILLAIWFYKLM